VEFVT